MADDAIDIELVVSEDRCRIAAELIAEYLSWVAGVARAEYGLAFDIEGMVRSDIEDKTKFFPPTGRLYLVAHAGRYVGVGALKQMAAGCCELQRMYVQPRARGLGVGRLLLDRLLADARHMGCAKVCLESLKALAPAHALYRSVGFREIQPYARSSMQAYQASDALLRYRESAVFMELELSPEPLE